MLIELELPWEKSLEPLKETISCQLNVTLLKDWVLGNDSIKKEKNSYWNF